MTTTPSPPEETTVAFGRFTVAKAFSAVLFTVMFAGHVMRRGTATTTSRGESRQVKILGRATSQRERERQRQTDIETSRHGKDPVRVKSQLGYLRVAFPLVRVNAKFTVRNAVCSTRRLVLDKIP